MREILVSIVMPVSFIFIDNSALAGGAIKCSNGC